MSSTTSSNSNNSTNNSKAPYYYGELIKKESNKTNLNNTTGNSSGIYPSSSSSPSSSFLIVSSSTATATTTTATTSNTNNTEEASSSNNGESTIGGNIIGGVSVGTNNNCNVVATKTTISSPTTVATTIINSNTLLANVDNPNNISNNNNNNNTLLFHHQLGEQEEELSTTNNSLNDHRHSSSIVPTSVVGVPPPPPPVLSAEEESDYGIANLILAARYQQRKNQHNTIGSFANPLLSIEPDTRNGSESLPRAFQPHFHHHHHKNKTNNKQSIYQRSLSIFTNGVSPLLLRKKKSNKQTSSTTTKNKQQRFYDLDQEFFNNNNNNNNLDKLSKYHNLSSSTLGLYNNSGNFLRRKSEPIMFSYDSITNELTKFQQREENIVKNINIDFEKMLMNDAGTTGTTTTTTTASQNIGVGEYNNSLIQQQQQAALANETSLRRLKYSHHSSFDHYGTNNKNTGASSSSSSATPQQLQQQSSHPQLSYKEPFYMVYEDNRPHLQHLQHHSNKHHHTNDNDNIYEEIDFLTLSSLRAQYADTLSLQSYKKKSGNNNGRNDGTSGSKRSLASSSFTRWFSTRKKNSPSMSEDENPYIDVKFCSKKQRPPITLPDPPGNLTKEQLKRRYIIGSIADSENSYINSLQRIINHYKKPLEESSPSILSQNKINIIFHPLEQILQCHTIFGIALSQCVREWDEKEQIGDVFIASFSKSMILDIYSDFINNFTNAMETARKAAKSKSSFAQFLQEKSLSSPDRLSFFGLMVKPVQRFPQFILLLSDLLKYTPPDHHDRMSLQLALTQLESLADRLNERKRDAERHFAVKQLLKDYLSSSTTNSSNRFLLRQDDIYQLELDTSSGLVMKTKLRKLYLLNDMLVCVSVPANRLKYAVSLQDVDVMDDVTPATNNLIANSMLKNKDPASASTSPKHCTVERMYCDLNSLIHDLEVISRVANLLSSLRYQYNGLSHELIEQIGSEIREEIRKKDAQITLIDRSCLQIRIRSKNYKDILCIQMNDPETKKDWLTDVRLAKLALDRANNPAWDIVNETISTTRTSTLSNSIIMHRVPLFVKSLPIFATTEHSMLTCALHYRIHRRDDLVLENNSGVLWICNVNENGSQLGALATNGTDISLIHSYELCDSHVTCIESVGSYAVWIGLRQGRIIVIDASSPGEWQQFAALDVSAEVTCIRYFGNFVYVGLITGVVALFNATHYEEPIIISLQASYPVTCLLPVNKEMFACCGEKIWIINNTQLDRSYYLHNNNQQQQPKNNGGSSTTVDLSSPDSLKPSSSTNRFITDEDLKPNLLAHCGIGLWVSLINSSIIKLYHTETFKHLQDVNVASNVKRILNEMIDPNGIFVTAMLATRGLLWIGTNVGVIVTLNLPRLQGVPLISGCLNVALHRHTGPVTILLNLTNTQSDIPIHPNNSSMDKNKTIDEMEKDDILKNEDVESIYGLYSDLMNVENYVRVGQDNRNDPHHMHHLGKMTWDLANINLSDDSTSESAIYQDGLHNILGKKKSAQNIIQKRRTLATTEHFNTNNSNTTGSNPAISPAKSQNSIYDSSMGAGIGGSLADNNKSQHNINNINNNTDKENISSSSGIGGCSSSLYDIAPFSNNNKGQKIIADVNAGKYTKYEPLATSSGSSSQRNFDPTATSTNTTTNTSNKTALLMTGGNGYKRVVTMNETTYSSQHAHCCIWEYKL